MKNKLKKIGMLSNVKYREDAVVYDIKGIARCIKCNGGGNYLIYEEKKKS